MYIYIYTHHWPFIALLHDLSAHPFLQLPPGQVGGNSEVRIRSKVIQISWTFWSKSHDSLVMENHIANWKITMLLMGKSTEILKKNHSYIVTTQLVFWFKFQASEDSPSLVLTFLGWLNTSTPFEHRLDLDGSRLTRTQPEKWKISFGQ